MGKTVAIRRKKAGGASAKASRSRRSASNAHRLTSMASNLAATNSTSGEPGEMGRQVTVATYNVHRWTGANGRSAPDPARAGFVISELDADVVALQEVLRPFTGDDPLRMLSDALGRYFVFAPTRIHKHGELGNAILARYPIEALSVLDISHSRVEKRVALAAQFNGVAGNLGVVATHLSLVDRTRHRQVEMLLDHPQFRHGPTVLMGDMNAWRKCKATRSLEDNLHAHHNESWPPSFPAARPVLALDRIYARGVKVRDIHTHDTPAARRASDHLPVIARLTID
jgi:endonuclease/exonuclease/phosphatase family metal-dependent hydrolase